MVSRTRFSRRTVLGASLLLSIFLLACIGSGSERELLSVGTVAPDFQVRSGDKAVMLADLRGDVVVVNFWSST